jgi:hypothetical protein
VGIYLKVSSCDHLEHRRINALTHRTSGKGNVMKKTLYYSFTFQDKDSSVLNREISRSTSGCTLQWRFFQDCSRSLNQLLDFFSADNCKKKMVVIDVSMTEQPVQL